MNDRQRSVGIVLRLAIVGPAAVVLLLEALALAVAGVTGENPRVPLVTLNLGEATAVRDAAEMVRLIEGGDDPGAQYPVRAGLLADEGVNATPLEVAVATRRSELVSLLYANGVRVGAADWIRLACFAKNDGSGDVLSELEARRPAEAELACTGDEMPLITTR